MKTTIIDANGVPIYRGNEANPKAAALIAAGNTQVSSAPPDDESKWNGSEWVPDSAKLAKQARAAKIRELAATDTGMIRVIEDIIANISGLRAQLPQSVQDKLSERENLRSQIGGS